MIPIKKMRVDDGNQKPQCWIYNIVKIAMFVDPTLQFGLPCIIINVSA